MRLLLLVAALGLGLLLASQWYDWPPPPDRGGEAVAPVQAPPSASAQRPSVEVAPLEPRDQYAEVVERPLFTKDRKPPAAEAAQQVPPESAGGEDELRQFVLRVVLITPQGRLAWVHDPTKGSFRRLRTGDRLAGWTVTEILPDRVKLKGNARGGELVLRDYSRPAPARKPKRRPIRSRGVRNKRAAQRKAAAKRKLEARQP